jgi:hypothetical protein
MKVGDLVKHRCPSTKEIGKVFLVIELNFMAIDGDVNWIRLLDEGDGWQRARDWRVINESR